MQDLSDISNLIQLLRQKLITSHDNCSKMYKKLALSTWLAGKTQEHPCFWSDSQRPEAHIKLCRLPSLFTINKYIFSQCEIMLPAITR